MMGQSVWDALWLGVRLATLDKSIDAPYGAIEDAAIAVKNGIIAWVGPVSELPPSTPTYTDSSMVVYNGDGRWITPGLIDCHTHLIYGGNRSQEFELRLNGVSYQEIAQHGGGILSTVAATRTSNEEDLLASASKRLEYFMKEGVTGIEIKSGYGLDLETELRMLRVARLLGESNPVDVFTTFLGAHTLPPEYVNSKKYINWLCEVVIPQVVDENLADALDVFCESIGFGLPETERIFRSAETFGIPIKAHVDQLSNIGGAKLAARYNALSVDHLEYIDQAGIDAIAASKSVAVLLPCAYYFLQENKIPPIEALRKAGVPMAVASDCNPGSSPTTSLLLMLNMACTLFRLTPEEALTGVTRHAAQALGWQGRCGTLEVGKQANFVLWSIEHPSELAYGIGYNPCSSVIKDGKIVHGQ